MEGNNPHQQTLNEVAGLLAREHRLLLKEREARERAEQAAADLAKLVADERGARERAEQAAADLAKLVADEKGRADAATRNANVWLAARGRAADTRLQRLRRLTDR